MAWQDIKGNCGTDDNTILVAEAPYHPGYEDASPQEFIKEKGRKFDGGKLEYGLLPPLALVVPPPSPKASVTPPPVRELIPEAIPTTEAVTPIKTPYSILECSFSKKV